MSQPPAPSPQPPASQTIHGWQCRACGLEVWAPAWDLAIAIHDFARCQRYHEWLARLAALETIETEYKA